jgi:hypothetical protein
MLLLRMPMSDSIIGTTASALTGCCGQLQVVEVVLKALLTRLTSHLLVLMLMLLHVSMRNRQSRQHLCGLLGSSARRSTLQRKCINYSLCWAVC